MLDLPKPHIKKTGRMWQCSSRHPRYAGCICISLGETFTAAYVHWLSSAYAAIGD